MLVPFRQQATNFWQKQSKPQRITMIVLVLAAIIIVPVLITWASTPTYAVAFSGLSEADAGQIVDKLTTAGIPYQLRNASTIMVPTKQVYDVRLMMASQGIPKNSTVGFELFDTNALGMTEFTQRVNYQRAMEGELERTIGSLDSVESVQVHIVTPEKTLFANEQQAATASVTLKIKQGQTVVASQVNAITHLVAASVEGMLADKVVVIDSNGKMLTTIAQDNPDLNSLTQADSHLQIEQLAAQGIQKNVQSMLDSVLGPDHATVQASVVMDWAQRETNSQTFNPTPAAARSVHTLNESYTLGGTTGGVPGAGSNLPTPVPTVVVAGGNTLYQKNEETINYELTQVQSKEIGAPGQVKRISVSVMVDTLKDAAQLSSIKSAVIAAAGIDSTRGDAVAVETMAFDRTYAVEEQQKQATSDQADLYIRIGQIAVAVLAVLILGISLMRMFSNLRKTTSTQWRPILRPVGEMAFAAGAASGVAAGAPMALGGQQAYQSIAAGEKQPGLPTGEEVTQTQQQIQSRIQDLIPAKSAVQTAEDEQLQTLMRSLTEENPATVAEIIQMWLNEG